MPYIPLEVYANNPSTTVSSGGTTGPPSSGAQESWTVASSAGFPAVTTGATQFHVADPALPGEVITVVNVSGTAWTVTRGAEGSTPVVHAAGFTVVQVVTAGALAAGQYLPWQFPVQAYGAKGDGIVVTDGAMTSGSHTLTCATSAPFLVSDVGKSILVSCAGGGTYSPLATTISGYTSSSVVTLTAAATSTTPGASIVGYATDDTAAIKAALAAAVAYANSNQGTYAELVFGSQLYGLGGTASPVNSAGLLGNALIPLPIQPPASEKLILVITCATKGLDQALVHWNQLTPQSSGAVLMCLRADGTNDGTYGPSSVIGGPFDGYGGDLGPFSNIMPVVDGIQILVPYNSTYGGFDFFGCAQAVVMNASVMTMAVVNYSADTGPPYPNMYLTPNNISNQWGWALRMPCTGNNDRADVFSFSSEGTCYGFGASEHTYASVLRCHYSITSIESFSGSGGMPHGSLISYASCEGSINGLSAFDGTVNMDITVLDTETTNPIIYDPSNRLHANIGLRYNNAPGYQVSGNLINGGANVRMLALDWPSGPVTSPQAAVASGAAWFNGYYRDAWITVQATTITALSISGVTQKIPPPTLTVTSFLLPSGESYTWTGTGTASHTVCLL